jgi:hypothetical protein
MVRQALPEQQHNHDKKPGTRNHDHAAASRNSLDSRQEIPFVVMEAQVLHQARLHQQPAHRPSPAPVRRIAGHSRSGTANPADWLPVRA